MLPGMERALQAVRPPVLLRLREFRSIPRLAARERIPSFGAGLHRCPATTPRRRRKDGRMAVLPVATPGRPCARHRSPDGYFWPLRRTGFADRLRLPPCLSVGHSDGRQKSGCPLRRRAARRRRAVVRLSTSRRLRHLRCGLLRIDLKMTFSSVGRARSAGALGCWPN